jgi:RNA polymerase sigma-70 factor (ECF subfamily)
VIGDEFPAVLTAAREGQGWAVAVLWRDLQPRLLRYLRAVDPAACEDIASETWLRAAQGLHRFQGDEPEFGAWMFTIARHRSIDWHRRMSRRPAAPMAPEDLSGHPASDDPAAAALEHLSTETALALVRTLPPQQAEVILLRVLGGLDTDRVAAIIGKRPGAVRVLQHRGLRRLAEAIAGSPVASARSA